MRNMTMVPTQTLDTSHFTERRAGPQEQVRDREARWWRLEPGDPGYDQELCTYVGMTEDEWRDYAISLDRCGGRAHAATSTPATREKG